MHHAPNRRTPTMRRNVVQTPGDWLGAHVSTRGGLHLAPDRGLAIGATVIQVFTKNPNRWRDPLIDESTALEFREAVERRTLQGVVAHDSYLINLATPDPTLRARSIESFAAELDRCHRLGIPYLVSHPGNYIDESGDGLARNAEACTEALRRAPGTTMVLLETTAGSGTALGSRFEELADLRGRIPEPWRHRVGVCVDTCHVYAAGYDLVHAFDEVWAAFDRIIGLEHLRCLHLNDSQTPFGSRRDRHALIAEGSLGPEPFRRVMTDPRFVHVMKVLETPKGPDDVTNDRRMLRRLRGYARRPRRR